MVFLSCLPLPSFKLSPLFPCFTHSSFSQLTIRRVTSTSFSSLCLHFSLLLYAGPLSVHTWAPFFYPLCPLFCSLVSISLCPLFLDDFREHWSHWPSDNNVLDRYILCVHVCACKYVSECLCASVSSVCVCVCTQMCAYSLLRHISLGSACGWALSF